MILFKAGKVEMGGTCTRTCTIFLWIIFNQDHLVSFFTVRPPQTALFIHL